MGDHGAGSVAAASEAQAWQRLRSARAFIFDMDGVLYRGDEVLPGVADILNALELRDLPVILATNNSMSTPANYVTKLAKMGIDVPEETIMTSGMATRDYLLATLPADAGLYVVGMPGLREQLFSETAFRPVQYGEETPAAVVVGLDLTFTYEKLKLANAALRAGALFVATNADATLPTESGLAPGAGSIIAAITTASGAVPTVIGKPETPLLEQALARLGVAADEAVMIGDRLDTDILGGNRAGMFTVMVLTGVSTREELATSDIRPDLVLTDLPALLEAIAAGPGTG